MHRNRAKTCAAAALLTLLAGTPAAAVTPEPAPARAADSTLRTISLETAMRSAAVTPFSLIGVTWADPSAPVEGVVEVRTRAVGTHRWSPWQALETDGRAPADERGSSDPLWVGPSDGVEARVAGTLPAGARVDLIDPEGGDGVQDATVRPEGRTARVLERWRAGVALPTRPVPRMVTRADWRANEAIVRAVPEYTGPTQVFFVHHTATGNGYSCSQSASIVRGIQAYQVRSRGWDDIGYNFLIDKCGTVFEGRGGGVGRTVLGAHTLGFNEDASAIAVLGSYEAQRVTPRVRTVIAAIAAYKLGAYGSPPNGRVVLTSGGGDRFPLGRRVPLYRISGHRDAGRTACPGDALYAQLPSIRALAGGTPSGLRIQRMGGATRAASLFFTKGVVQPVWSVTTPTALINRFEVWADGMLRTAAPGGHNFTQLRLPPGLHTVTVRALHLSGRSTAVSSRVVVDPDAPVFHRRPALALRPGTVTGTSVPMQLDWNVSDSVALSSVGLTRPSATNLGTTALTRNVGAPANRPAVFTVRATDRAANVTDASVTRTPWVVSEVSAQRRGSWRALRNTGYLGGTAVGGSTRGASASWRFTGSSAALVFSKGPHAGRVGISVDGRPQGIVDLHSTAIQSRQVVWTGGWSQSGEHTVRVVVEGTRGRPGVALDGLIYLR